MIFILFNLIFFFTPKPCLMSNEIFRSNENSLKQFLNDQLKPDLNESDAGQRHYCRVCCLSLQTNPIEKHCGQHTLCKYSANEIGSACHGFITIPFSKKEKLLIVFMHNQLRNHVALGKEDRGNPGPQYEASNMREMFWSEELAVIADRWAAQCVFKNDLCRDTARFPVGQNIAEGQSAINDEMYFIRSWYNVVQDYNRDKIRNITLENRFNPYTQVIWADTYLIGCSRIMFQMNYGSEIYYKEHMICNYGPSGNINGQFVYLIGKPCTNCPFDTKCSADFEGLCTGNVSSPIMMPNELPHYEFNFINRTFNKRRATNISTGKKLILIKNNANSLETLYFESLIIFYIVLYVIHE